jgi:16S rRNA (adenine1518-N6/adenine1519-N6)-dimethyltransferase
MHGIEMNLPALPVKLPNYNSGTALRSFLAERGFSVRKQWGQNFLTNPGARKIRVDELAAEHGDAVWEIGSGLGCMTHELLERGIQLTAFEIDLGLCSVLEELFAPHKNFTLVRGDVLKTWKTAERASCLLGNLPYTIAALLMGNLITEACFFSRMLITVQKEVAFRMAAKPGSKDYSSISVLCASAYSMKLIMTLKGASFYPPPHVDSAIIRFDRLNSAPLPNPLFYPLVRALFASRRKTIANNLQIFIARSCTMKGKDTAEVAREALKTCGLSGRERAEDLSHLTFMALAEELAKGMT